MPRRHRNDNARYDVQSAIDQLSYPTFHLNTSGGTSSLSGGALPWWATPPPAAATGSTPAPAPASPLYGTAPESHRSPGYMGEHGYGYGNVGGSPTGDLGPGYQLNSRQAARLGGGVVSALGGPGDLASRLINMYSQRTGANNPFGPTSGGSFTPGVTVTDNDTNQEPQFRYQGYGSDPLGGGFGDVYYGPARGGSLADYGDASMNNFGQSQLNYWDTMHRNSNIGSAGMGGYGTGWHGGTGAAGGADLIFSGSASPWDWGGGYSF